MTNFELFKLHKVKKYLSISVFMHWLAAENNSLGLQHYSSWWSLPATGLLAQNSNNCKPSVLLAFSLYNSCLYHLPNLNVSVQLHGTMVDCQMWLSCQSKQERNWRG